MSRTVEITSTSNARVTALARLHRRRERRRTGRYLVEGPNAVNDALVDGVVDELWVADGFPLGTLPPVGDDVDLVRTSEAVLSHLGDAETTQGVLAVARWREAGLAGVVGRGWLLALDGVADPGNLGTLVRTADALGAAGVVLLAGSVDPTNPKVVRAAAGSLTHLPIVTGATAPQLAAACAGANQPIVGLAADDEALDLRHAGLGARPLVLLAGSEAHGLSDAARAACAVTARIPHGGRAESLNLAAAVAVAAWEVVRSDRP